ncbi:hypothetical protein HNR60_003625 [Rhodopseudomonas rhenobacensis]|uniref:Uncharacterized protein n=1 Tax=Rhodopseudomonas rhenobacensis TaxID=87461 RepID=A0A7W7Z6S6_9BRAD|nr:hypothetical protein [Rhodopseudomonas rhenobacensis]
MVGKGAATAALSRRLLGKSHPNRPLSEREPRSKPTSLTRRGCEHHIGGGILSHGDHNRCRLFDRGGERISPYLYTMRPSKPTARALLLGRSDESFVELANSNREPWDFSHRLWRFGAARGRVALRCSNRNLVPHDPDFAAGLGSRSVARMRRRQAAKRRHPGARATRGPRRMRPQAVRLARARGHPSRHPASRCALRRVPQDDACMCSNRRRRPLTRRRAVWCR